MIKLNDSNIYIGQIKQLLHNFNLLKPIIINNSNLNLIKPIPNTYFIKGDNIYYWDDKSKEIFIDKYIYNKSYLNLTSNLKINNLLYDIKTHRYLGKYLRFLRDYHNIDLMCMYNCCDYELMSNNIHIAIKDENIYFDNADTKYDILSIPITLSNVYTITSHSYVSLELCLCLDNNYQEVKNNVSGLATQSYSRIKSITPFTYKPFANLDDDILQLISKYRSDLKLLIKIPKNLKTSVVVLEGDYVNNKSNNNEYFVYKPRSCDSGDLLNYMLDTGYYIDAQLLSHENTSSKYLLADRLIQYLSSNAISKISIDYEIKRLQLCLDALRKNNKYNQYLCTRDNLSKDRYYGYWSQSDTYDMRSLMFNLNLNNAYDMLGYMDSDFEKFFIKEGIDDAEL